MPVFYVYTFRGFIRGILLNSLYFKVKVRRVNVFYTYAYTYIYYTNIFCALNISIR